ncbi:MAG: phosphoribosylformylglycinamidine synthase subunit PurQ, partial [Methanoregula sp.]|nr:phosphoribosylformylglycinamidine synthase subunit PurQ [Methanoregula sp.]
KGNAIAGANPNGAAENITGILSAQGNVCAMMPNPERASEALLGPVDGKKIFDSMICAISRKD